MIFAACSSFLRCLDDFTQTHHASFGWGNFPAKDSAMHLFGIIGTVDNLLSRSVSLCIFLFLCIYFSVYMILAPSPSVSPSISLCLPPCLSLSLPVPSLFLSFSLSVRVCVSLPLSPSLPLSLSLSISTSFSFVPSGFVFYLLSGRGSTKLGLAWSHAPECSCSSKGRASHAARCAARLAQKGPKSKSAR